jgi:plasmid maintenance system antidote protein VapI
MRMDFKIAILQSGKHQFEVAQEANLSEGRLSRFIREREQLRADEEQRLRHVLGLTAEKTEVASAHVC